MQGDDVGFVGRYRPDRSGERGLRFYGFLGVVYFTTLWNGSQMVS